jgi:hypothetical protein
MKHVWWAGFVTTERRSLFLLQLYVRRRSRQVFQAPFRWVIQVRDGRSQTTEAE